MPLRDPQDRQQFAEMLGAVNAVLNPGARELTKPVIEMYWNAMAAYDIAAVRQALDRHVKNPDTGQFMPKPADLIRMLQGSTQDSAWQAWAIVERSIRQVGGYMDVVFDDPLIHRCIADMGGWVKLCDTREDELPFRAKDFQTLYRGYKMRQERPAYPPQLTGRSSLHNSAKGFSSDPVIMIGSEDGCRQVILGAATVPMLQITSQKS